jgi:SAM-dependent methyltransferase
LTPDLSGTYLHGTHPEEQRRLSRLNDVMNARCLGEIALRGGERILDVGSGLGQLSRAMARAAGPAGHVLAIERSPDQLAQAEILAREQGDSGLVEFRAGDAVRLPLRDEEWGSFDVAHTRFLLEHVPDPLAVVRSMVRAVVPGGRIILEDDDHDVLRLHPEPPGFGDLWRSYMLAFDRAGNDPFVGRRLVALLHDAGARPVRSTWIYFGACAGEAQFSSFVENLIGVISGVLGEPEYRPAIDAIRAWGQLPEAVLWYSVCYAEGRSLQIPCV